MPPKYVFNPYQIKFIIFRINNTYTYLSQNIQTHDYHAYMSQKIHDKEALHIVWMDIYREAQQLLKMFHCPSIILHCWFEGQCDVLISSVS